MALTTNEDQLVAMVLSGWVTHPELDASPFQVGADGRPYLPFGAGGVLYGYGPGARAFVGSADHPEPGATIKARDERSQAALAAFACLGNEAWVAFEDGRATGVVVGLRGEGQGLFVHFQRRDLRRISPGQRISVRCCGSGLQVTGFADIAVHHLSQGILSKLADVRDGQLVASVRARIPSYLLGNGVGRPAATWETDLQSDDPEALRRHGCDELRIGDVVAMDDWEAVTMQGYAPGATTIGVVVHGDSPLPGHGPGILPVLSGSAARLVAVLDPVRPHLFDDLAP